MLGESYDPGCLRCFVRCRATHLYFLPSTSGTGTYESLRQDTFSFCKLQRAFPLMWKQTWEKYKSKLIIFFSGPLPESLFVMLSVNAKAIWELLNK